MHSLGTALEDLPGATAGHPLTPWHGFSSWLGLSSANAGLRSGGRFLRQEKLRRARVFVTHARGYMITGRSKRPPPRLRGGFATNNQRGNMRHLPMDETRRHNRKAIAALDKKILHARRLGMDEATIQLLERHQENYRKMILDTYVLEDIYKSG